MTKTLMAAALASLLALPVTASAASDRLVVAQGGGGADAPDMTNRQPGMSSQPGTMESDKMNARFEQLDRNHDGYISRDEANDAPELQTRFSELDTNNDGKLSREEYGALNASASGATGTGRMSGSGANTK